MTKLSPTKRRPPTILEVIGERLRQAREKHSTTRRYVAAGLLAIAAAAPFIIHERSGAVHQGDGEAEAGLAQALATGVLGAWSSQSGFGPLAARPPEWTAPWGAIATLRPAADGSSVAVEYAYASKKQCEGLTRASQAYFERASVDGQLANASDPGSACTNLGQNAIILLKTNTRATALATDAGRASSISGGWIPQRAFPATAEQLRQARPPELPSSPSAIAKRPPP